MKRNIKEFLTWFETPTYGQKPLNVGEDFVKYKPPRNDFSEGHMKNIGKYQAGELFSRTSRLREIPEDWNAQEVKVCKARTLHR